mmetsp:Transcript_90077/g.257574  ORF Transcript_90077/g.257574 Transcript_90077/m.257574 type:complete len:109 (+) Transcript_90077:422-748(+)
MSLAILVLMLVNVCYLLSIERVKTKTKSKRDEDEDAYSYSSAGLIGSASVIREHEQREHAQEHGQGASGSYGHYGQLEMPEIAFSDGGPALPQSPSVHSGGSQERLLS